MIRAWPRESAKHPQRQVAAAAKEESAPIMSANAGITGPAGARG